MVANLPAAGGNSFCKTNTPEFGAGGSTRNRVYGATGNPFNPELTVRRVLRWLCRRARRGPDAAGNGLRLRRFAADALGLLRHRGFPTIGRRQVPAPDRAAGLVPWSVLGPMGRSVADAYLLMRAQVDACTADPFSVRGLELTAALSPADLASVRATISVDMGEAPVSEAIREVFAKKALRFGRHIEHAEQAHPDFSGVHEVFEIHRGIAYVTAHQDKLKSHRGLLDRNFIDNTQRGSAHRWRRSAAAISSSTS